VIKNGRTFLDDHFSHTPPAPACSVPSKVREAPSGLLVSQELPDSLSLRTILHTFFIINFT